jgi:hypothetical protein
MSEFLRRTANSKIAVLVGGLAIGAGVTAGIYEGVPINQTAAKPGSTCETPASTSPHLYPRGPNTTKDQSTWKTAVEINTSMPAGEELVASWSNDGVIWSHDSNPVVGDFAKKIFLRIGNKAVAFRTRLIAVYGTPACETPPDSHFSEPQPVRKLFNEGAVEPTWQVRH